MRGKGYANRAFTDARSSLYAVLGPCPCAGCGVFVYWARSRTRLNGQTVKGLAFWRERTGRIHHCVPKTLTRSALYSRASRARKRAAA